MASLIEGHDKLFFLRTKSLGRTLDIAQGTHSQSVRVPSDNCNAKKKKSAKCKKAKHQPYRCSIAILVDE